MILGAGVGWNDVEYEAVGVHKSERGKRTDEMLDIMIPLLEGETVTYHGRYYSVDDVFIEPIASQRPEIWIGGGSQLADPKSPDLPRFVESVKARTLRTDGWIPRPTCPPDDIARDWAELQAYYREHGRDPRECVVAHENFLHLVLTNDPVKAREEQHRAFLKVMSAERGEHYLESVYLFGTPDEVDRLAPGARRRRRRVLHAPHDDAGPGPAPGLGRRDHPQRDVPGDGRVRCDGASRRRRGDASGSRCSASRSGGATRRSCTTLRSRRPGSTRATSCCELDADDGRAASVAEARGPGWLGLGVTAPYKRLVAGLCDEVEPDATAIGAVNNVVRTADGAAGRLQHRRAGLPGRRPSSRWAGRSTSAEIVVAGAGGAAHAVVYACLRAGARRVTVGNRTSASAAALAEPLPRASGTRGCAAVRWTTPPSRRAPVGGPRRQRHHRGHGRPRDDDRRRGRCRPGRPCSTSSTCRPRPRCSRAARARGLRAANGSEMLIAQAAHRVRALDRRRRHGRTSCARPSRRSSPTPARGPDRCASRRSSTTGGRPSRSCARDGACPLARQRGRRPCARVAGGAPAALAASRGAGPMAGTRPTGARSTTSARTRRAGSRCRSTRSGSTTGRRASRRARPGAAARLRQGVVVRGGPRRGARLGPLAHRERRRRVRARRWSSADRLRGLGDRAMGHVFGYTIVNDVSSRDPWLDGDQWLLGKSMPGFCPVGPWIVTRDELDRRTTPPRLHRQRRRDPGRQHVADALRRSPRSSPISAGTWPCAPAT